ncbi:MAG: hypothetical protein P1U89_14700 [Verrucomicrobiales bacterium]|nr:hypothetical protein [Verrucomicrobiales bacterium]
MKNCFKLIASIAMGCSFTMAGEYCAPTEDKCPVECCPEKEVTGFLSLDAYSHFISYGNDVWGDGGRSGDYGFNPAFGLNFQITDKLSANIGTWWDMNDKGTSPIGGQLQEVDVWGGLAYSFGIVELSTTYQQWYYGGGTEEILDIGIGFDVFLSPSITVHNRLDVGASGGDEGTVIVVGGEYGFDVGCVSFGIPVGVGLFATDDFHGAGAETGFGYASVGLTASVPLKFMDCTLGGSWAFNAGATYYHTDNDVTINNPEEDFVVTNFGIGLDF